MATSPSLFRILKGAEKKDNNTKQSVMLDKDKSGLAIQEGTIYVTTDDGNMYIDVSPTKRIKIGALADRALRADKDENGNQLITTYIASLKYEAQTNTTNAANLPSIKGIAMDGKTVISTIPLPSASTGNNGLVSTTAQTFGGNKTFKDNLAVTGNTALTGTLGVTGKTTLNDVLDVTGTTTLKSTLGVAGNTTLGGTLGVTGATTLTGNLTANGSVTMAQSLTISGIINSLVEKSAPFVVKSNIKVTNLNADKVDGYDVTNNDFSTAKDTDMSIPSVGAVIKTFLPLLQSIQGLRYRGSVDLTQTTDDGRFGKDVLSTVKVGDVFMISKGGAYAGIYLEPADMLVCVAKSGSAITWNYIQSNINGAVTIKGATESNTGANPLVSVDSIPIFSAATGRQITGSKIFIDGAGHLLPASSNTKQCLGSEERKWITVWANTFQGTDFNGVNFNGTTFKGTDFTGTTFTGTTFTGNAASASKWKTARTITVKGADTGSVTLDGSQNVTLTLTVAHTHNYAGSSSAGGAANSANKLNTNAGSGIQPVFFTNGVPKVCIPYAEASVKYADDAGVASCLYDAMTPDEIIFIGCDNNGFTAAEVNYALGMDDSRQIKNVSKAEYKEWLDLGSAAYTESSAYAAATHTHNYAGSNKSGGAANSANKLNTSAGDNTNPIYFADGIPVKSTASVGSANQPVYLNNGVITACSGSQSGSETYKSFVMTGSEGTAHWHCLGTLVSSGDSSSTIIDVYTGNGWNGSNAQNTHIGIFIKDGSQSTQSATTAFGATYLIYDSDTNATSIQVKCMASAHNTVTIYIYLPWAWGNGYYSVKGRYSSWTHVNTTSTSAPTSGIAQDCVLGTFRASKVYGAVWNDYAEYRKSNCKIPGKCIIEVGDDTLKLSTKRLQPGAEIISDTFGFAIGETEDCETPIAVSGRVLAYPYEPLEKFRENIGKPVCSGPNGTVSIMADEEYQKFGYCAIGTISAVPDYEVWGSGNVKVNGRVWIKV